MVVVAVEGSSRVSGGGSSSSDGCIGNLDLVIALTMLDIQYIQ